MSIEEIVSEDTQNQSYEYQTKIRDQAKRLYSQENYISLLEARLKKYSPTETVPGNQSLTQHTTFAQSSIDLQTKPHTQSQLKRLKGKEPNDNIYDLYNQLISENQRLAKEKEEISSTLKAEIINNDEQRNQIEILKQAIESSIIQSGLKSKLDLIKKKYYKATPNEDYSKIILDITSMKNQNEELSAQCHRMKKELSQSELFKERVQKSVDMSIKEIDNAKSRICSLEKENNILIKELSALSSHNKSIEENLDKAIKEKDGLSNSFEALSSEHNSMKINYANILKEKGDCLSKMSMIELESKNRDSALHEVKVQNEIMKSEKANIQNQTDQFYSTVKALQEKYEALLSEFYENKKLNHQLCKDNALLEVECNGLRGQLYKLNDLVAIENENKRLFCTLNQLENEMNIITSERCCLDNYYQGKLSEIINEKRRLEEVLNKQSNEISILKGETTSVKRYQCENGSLATENKLLTDNNSKALNENNFYYNFLMKVIKSLIENKPLQKMLLSLIDLNIGLMNLAFEKEKSSSLISTKEMDRLYEQILAIENEVKRYEVYST